MWEGVGDRTELQHIDPHSIGHNCVFFPFSWVAQPGAWGPTLLGAGFLYRILSPTGLVSKLTDFLSSPSYIIVQRPPSCGRHKLHSFNPSMVKVIISWLTGCTCYLQGAFPILTAWLGRRSIYNIGSSLFNFFSWLSRRFLIFLMTE